MSDANTQRDGGHERSQRDRTVGSVDRRRYLTAVAGGAVVPLVGCLGDDDAPADDAADADDASDDEGSDDEETLEIVVGSWNYTEQIILGYMLYEVLDHNTPHDVVDRTNYGNNEEVWEGFEAREFHVFPDYTGTLWMGNPPYNEEAIPDPDEQYEAVKAEMEDEHDLRILEMTDFENSFAFAAEEAFVEETGIETISDLAAHVNDGNYDVSIAMQSDFYERSDGWPGLVDHYGFEADAVEEWEDEHDATVLTEIGVEADEVDAGNVDVGLVYSTDAVLDEYGLQIIEDDESFWPYYNVVPVVAEEKATDDVVEALNEVPVALGNSDEWMAAVNARVDVGGEDPHQVAYDVLNDQGVI